MATDAPPKDSERITDLVRLLTQEQNSVRLATQVLLAVDDQLAAAEEQARPDHAAINVREARKLVDSYLAGWKRRVAQDVETS